MDATMDPNLEDFYSRIARVQAAHSRGYGFEADGTIGRSYYGRPSRRSFPVIKALCVVALSVIALKGVIHYHLGDTLYADRVATLQAGQGFDRLGGWLMAADPATLWISDALTQYVGPRL